MTMGSRERREEGARGDIYIGSATIVIAFLIARNDRRPQHERAKEKSDSYSAAQTLKYRGIPHSKTAGPSANAGR